ncbi:MAG TPA: VOC family protein [Phototrophicaceae bacterium]|jgi:predicted enzyme related to lactoylglutathione lyase|nr:VOC family protein [Phototrophicaceae bacterium]
MDKRVTGIGGIFFKSKDPQALGKWYAKHLGIGVNEYNMTIFPWRYQDDPEHKGETVWAIFDQDSDYFGSADAQLMINYRVEDLEAVIAALRAEGVEIVKDIENSEQGRFAWIRDPDGRRIELWQAPADD